MPDEEQKTFDLTLSGATAEDLALLTSGLGQQMRMYLELGSEDGVASAASLLGDLLAENRKMSRHMLLEADTAEHMSAIDLSDDLMDELDIEIVDGAVMDAERMTDIEVE